MYSKFAGVLLPVMAVAAIGLGVWGYQENTEKNSILIKAENQYQRAFHDLNFHLDELQDELGKTLALNSRRQLDGHLSNVWRISSLARADLGQLPLALLPFSKTEEFLADIGDFSYEVAVRDLNKEPLSEKEYQTLKTLHQRAQEIEGELRKVQDKVLNQQLRWMDVELALAAEEQNLDNTIIDGFRTIDKTVKEYGEVDLGPGVQSLQNKERFKAENLTGQRITAEQAKQKAFQFVGLNGSEAKAVVKKTGKGYEYEAYSVSIEQPGEKDKIHLDITAKGGHVVWLLDDQDVRAARLGLEQARGKADQFLRHHGYKNMEPIIIDRYGNLAVLTYVYTEDSVRIYPDLVTVKVALDTGNVVGFQSEDYIFNHKPRSISKSKLTKEQARKQVNPNLQVQESRLAMVFNDRNKETLCYEFVGRIGNETYRIFIDAQTGDEVTIEKLDGPGQDR